MTLLQPVTSESALAAALDVLRGHIEVLPAELDEARNRRNAIGAALLAEFTGSRIYVNGSVAHGDALTPLTDVDLGCVILDPDHIYGPGRRGPAELEERAANAIRAALRDSYEGLIVEWRDRKRSILVKFRDPVAPGLPDFTADVIMAVDNWAAAGLYIPRYTEWDRSHPEKHTELVADANRRSRSRYARAVRLLKHWNRHHGMPLCSWNIKALALDSISDSGLLIDALVEWFEDAVVQLTAGPTPDPAHVAARPITIEHRLDAVAKLRNGLRLLHEAEEMEAEGYPVLALEKLSRFFDDPDVMPFPNPGEVIAQAQRRTQEIAAKQTQKYGSPTLITGANAQAEERRNVRSWGL